MQNDSRLGRIVRRTSCGIDYDVDICCANDIFLPEEILEDIQARGYDLAVEDMAAYLRLRQGAYSPVLLSWDMTSRCNFRCQFCYIRNNNPLSQEVKIEQAKPAIDALVSEGLFLAYLSGGECLLLEDFIEIYSYLKTKGVLVTVFTNGALINDSILDTWRRLPPSSIEITVYDDDFASPVFSNILKLIQQGHHVVTKFTLTTTTKQFLANVRTWSSSHGIDLLVDAEIFDGEDSDRKGLDEKFGLPYDEKVLLNGAFLDEGDFEKPSKRGALPCGVKTGAVHIAPDFTMSLCQSLRTRWDLNTVETEMALDEIRSFISTYENAQIAGCHGCIFSSKCTMCVAHAETIDSRLVVPNGFCNDLETKWSPVLEKLAQQTMSIEKREEAINGII